MDVRSLPIDLLLNRTLFNSAQNQNRTAASLPSNSFTTLLTEVLLTAELANQTNTAQTDSSRLLASLTLLASSIGLEAALPGQNSTGISNSFAPSISGNTPEKNHSLESIKVSPADLNSQLKGVLKNMGEVFSAAGQKYQINPALLASIAMHETGNGTSNAAKYKNNIAGMMGKNGLKTYDSIPESIFDMARNLRQNYLDKEKTTIASIGAKYAPIGAANDPTNLNNHWVKGVQRNFDNFTKTTDFA